MVNSTEGDLAARNPSIWDKYNSYVGILYDVTPIPIEDLRLPFSLRQHIDFEGNSKYRAAQEVYERLDTISYHSRAANFAQYHPDHNYGIGSSSTESKLAGSSL